MPYSKNLNPSYDKELWESLIFISDTWNKGPQIKKLTYFDWNTRLKKTIKDNYEYDMDGPIDMVLTILVEFFFCPRDDGKHLYEYFHRGSLDDDEWGLIQDKKIVQWCIPVPQPDGTRHVYWPFHTMEMWLNTSPDSLPHPPVASEIYDGGHFDTRCLLRIMLEKGIVKKEWLEDYELEKDSYALIPFEAIDKRIDEKPLDHVPDPYGVIERGEVERLYKSIKTACEHLCELFKVHPEMFEL